MSKAQVTKDYIIQQAAGLFNRQGYVGSSIADVMAITGLKKGGDLSESSRKTLCL
jgi:TetR/AcrR family transcriptional regulator, transcriptional repressor for nem operon